MGDDEHLTVRRERREGTADREGSLAPDPCIDLVEHQRLCLRTHPSPAQHQAYREHGAREFAARRHSAERQEMFAGVGRKQEHDLVAGSDRSDLHREHPRLHQTLGRDP
ncbi:MAG: hypothetical protein ACLGHT_13055, partial [Acidimicrobiia bacterium]